MRKSAVLHPTEKVRSLNLYQKVMAVSLPERIVVDKTTPMNPGRLIADYNIEARRATERWQELVRDVWSGVDPVDALLQSASAYGLPHYHVDRIFRMAFTQFDLPTPYLLIEFKEIIEKARLLEIPVTEFTEHLEETLDLALKRLTERGTGVDVSERVRLARECTALCTKPIDVMLRSEGPATPSLSTVKGYEKLHLLALPGGSTRAQVDRVRQLSDPRFRLNAPDLEHLDHATFTVISPPRPGEYGGVTRVRILLEWMEVQAGQILRECYLASLSRGTLLLPTHDADIFSSPLHTLVGGIRQKLGGKIPYFLDELCLNHGLTAWEALAQFDAEAEKTGRTPEILPEGKGQGLGYADEWDFTVYGLNQNIQEILANPLGFQLEVEYVRDLLPWAMAGKVHPAALSMIYREFRSKDHRNSPDRAAEILVLVRQAVTYVNKLLESVDRVDESKVWESFDAIRHAPTKEKLRAYVMEALSAATAAEFKNARAKLFLQIHPDRARDNADLTAFCRVFIEYAILKRTQLEASKI